VHFGRWGGLSGGSGVRFRKGGPDHLLLSHDRRIFPCLLSDGLVRVSGRSSPEGGGKGRGPLGG